MSGMGPITPLDELKSKHKLSLSAHWDHCRVATIRTQLHNNNNNNNDKNDAISWHGSYWAMHMRALSRLWHSKFSRVSTTSMS